VEKRCAGVDWAKEEHAIRVLGRAWTRVIWRMWQDCAPYDPSKHGNLRRLETSGG
jgi:hypothetical protein